MGKNQIKTEDRAIHDWYQFVLAYPPHLVREYLEKFNAATTHGAKPAR